MIIFEDAEIHEVYEKAKELMKNAHSESARIEYLGVMRRMRERFDHEGEEEA